MLNHEELTREETKDILIGITQSEYPNEQITALLTALQMRGITVEELLGFRDGILETGVPVPLDCDRYIDVVGTGGDRKNTFNISTTSCFVIAGAGYKVAKHGNYAATSTSGASNVIAHHGIQFTDDIDKLNRQRDGGHIAAFVKLGLSRFTQLCIALGLRLSVITLGNLFAVGDGEMDPFRGWVEVDIGAVDIGLR